MSIRSGNIAMEHNGSGVKEVAPAQMFNFSTKLQGAISFNPLLYEVFFWEGKKD